MKLNLPARNTSYKSCAYRRLSVVVMFTIAVAQIANAASFTTGNLAVLQADASANNTTCTIVEISPTTPGQTTPSNSFAIAGTGTDALRISGSAGTTGYLALSDDKSLLCFTGANSTNTSSNVNTLTARGVGTLSKAGVFTLQTTYTGVTANQTRGATSLNNTTWFIADQSGVYSNGTSTASPALNLSCVKSFGGVVYGSQAKLTTFSPVVTVTAATGGSTVSLPGLPNNATTSAPNVDFYLISSGSNGSAYDILYVLNSTSATAGSIDKFSLVSGTWTANGSYTTSFGGFSILAAKNGSTAVLYVTSGNGSTVANNVIKLADTAGYNTTINITTANNVVLYTAPAAAIAKGISFAPTAPTDINLANYARIGRYDLPEPTRTTPPNGTNLLGQEASAVTYNWDTDTLFITGDGGTSIVQVSKTGQLIDTMTLAPGSSPQGTDFYDPEGITYIGNNKFVFSEERDRQLVQFTYAAGTTLTRANAKTVKLGTFVNNIGTEGVSYDPQTGGYICIKETQPQGVFQTGVDFDAGTATNGSATTENSINLFDPTLANLSDLADVFALSNLPSLNGQTDSSHLLLLSQESAKIVNISRTGVVSSSLSIRADAGNPLTASAQQHEGLTMDREGNLYVVSENGGGDFDHPQLWVYAPSTVANQAPTAVVLSNTTTSIVENTGTTAAIKLADISITDDALGSNDLAVTGTDASFFQIVDNALYLKAGTVLDYETKTSYSINITADDTTVGSSPDATTPYTLAVTDIVNETPVLPALIISEVAAWSSGNSPVGADWFEVTNTGATAVDITGWKVDDSSASFASALALNGITSIAPGESVIFMETADLATASAAFKNNWFGANPPAGLQIGSYTGASIGLSTSGDGVNLYNAAGVLQASVSFGASPSGPTFATFNNAAGLNSATISQLSVVGTNGAFVAANDANEIGSPGSVGKLFISEVAPWSSGNSPVGADWFEVTNTTAFAVDVTGWKVDDSSESFAAALALNGITSIASGESVIFMETADLPTTSASFKNIWFGANPPAGLKIGNYSGASIGLSTGGDAVVLYNSSGVIQAKVTFGSSPTGPSFATFDNKAALNNTAISQLSATGINGAFSAINDANEIGSPGTILYTAPIVTTQPASVTISSGSTATLTAAATGSPSPVFQWYQGNSGDTSTPIAGATSSSFTTPQLSATTSYWVRATNTGGSADSNTATVTIINSPVYGNANFDILAPNTDVWSATGVTVNGTQFIDLGLQGVGRFAASTKDPVTGESVGSVSDMQITGWKKNADGTYAGTFNFLPDRGYNSGVIFSNYAARINAFDFTFTPYTSATPTTSQNQIAMTFLGSTRFTYDHDGNTGTPPIFTTGLNANSTASLFGTTVPAASGNSTQSDGTFANRLTLDSEGLIFDKRAGKSGSGWVGDEYGAYIYHFNSAKQIDGQVQLPPVLIPHSPVGTVNFNGTPLNGRRDNQGMEGIAQSPDGKKLFGLMQSATIQDSGAGNQGRFNARLLVYDLTASDTPNDPAAQYVIQLPRIDSTGSTTNGSTTDRAGAQSSILALNDHQLLILSRDGNGRGAAGSPVFKSILLADLASATNIDGSFDAEGNAVAPSGVLNVSVTPISWSQALNLIGGLGSTATEVAKFGLNLKAAPGDINSICEKWEAISLVSANDAANPNDYFLFVGNDNDFMTGTGKYMDASGALQSYDAGLENDTLVLAYRVRVAGTDNQAPFVANAIPTQTVLNGQPLSYAFPANTFSDPNAGQTFTYTATKADDSALPAWLSFDPNTRTFSGTPGLSDVGSLSVKVTATDNGTPALWGSTTFTITVTAPSFSFASTTASVREDAGKVSLTINRTGDLSAASINVSTADGTGLAGTDYTALSNFVVSFASSDVTKTVDIFVKNRPGIRSNRTFTATLSSAGAPSVTGSPVTTTVTITEADSFATNTGISSSATPYVQPLNGSWQTTSLLSVGDIVPLTGTTTGQTFQMVGIPDGLGAYDNGDGTLTLLMNHELGDTLGGVRSHGSVGAFVSEWIINKSTLQVISGSDLMRSVYGWNAGAQASNTTTSSVAFNRFCSADLPPVSAFYNPATGLGTQERIFMNGDESGANGYAMAHVATGPNKGKSYVLGKFNLSTNGSGLTGVGGWENILANPLPQDKTVVVGDNDGGTGIMTNSVAVYVGTKTNTGTEADKAGLTNGVIKFVNVTGNTAEIVNTTTRATNITSGTAFTLSATASTTFSRPEDGAWDTTNPNRFYFVTTDRLDQVSDGLGAQVGRTRLWRLNFTNITNPDLGGTIDLLLEGGVGNDANMWDNMTVTTDGKLMLQEDVGGAAHNGKVWSYDPVTGSLSKVLKHDVSRFGDVVSGVTTAATSPFTNDEETSGIIDVTALFGGNAAIGDRYFLTSDQAHYPLASPLVEGGQLVLVHQIATSTGISSSSSPYLLPMDSSWKATSVLSVGDTVPLTGTTTGQTFQMVGIPDGLGAFDNGDGTMTVLMNHELGDTLGGVRSHGSVGAFVSEWIINKSTLQVVSGSDLIHSVYGWNSGTQASNTTTSTVAFNRFCSADLPPVSAFYNAATGLGTQERLFMNGDESGANGYAMAHVATGPNKGKSYVLGKFNLSTNGSGLTGVGGWENVLANPLPQNKTVVIGNNDGGTGIMTNSVAVYVGAKTNTGTEADKAGLTNGVIKFVNVTGNAAEVVNTTTRATNITSGAAFTLSATASTTFSRPEDGAWDTTNPNRYYFVTTDRLDQVADGLGSQAGRTRLWRLNFTDITNPDLGGTIDLLVQGGVGNDANMWDNMTVTKEGKLLLQEDVGGAAHNGKIWFYDPVSGSLAKVLRHDPARFGDVLTAATAPFTNDEEGSGIIDVTSILAGNAAAGEHLYLTSDQAHYPLASPLVEGGQLVLLRQAPTIAISLAEAATTVSETAGTMNVAVNRFGDLQYGATVNLNTTNGTAAGGTDFTALTNFAVNFAPGESLKVVPITIINRSGVQGDRTFTVSLTNPSAGTVLGSPATTTVTIAEGDAGFAFAASTAVVREDSTKVTLTINRTGNAAAATINVSTSNGTATAGTDYTALSSFPVAFAANQGSKTVDINVAFRAGIQGSRTFTASLASPGAGVVTVTPASAVVTITEADSFASLAGPSTTATPYIQPLNGGTQTTSILSVGDAVPLTGTTTAQTFQMVGLPDGLGAFDNGDGTITVLMNHELGDTLGGIRSHGSVGAFVSEWIINKSTLQVVSGSDLIRSVYGWNAGSQASNSTTSTVAFNRLCSADLPQPSAFYNAATGLGTQERIFMNGDESGANGYAMAHVATGPNKGKSYVLGKFNLTTNGSGLTGVGGWENLLANPLSQNKTVVIGNNDGGTGIMNNSVSVYVGTKTNTGTEADKAGLTNGVLKFVNVTGNTAEIINTTTRATNITSGTAFTLSGTASTTFSRPEDGAWDTTNPNRFYFVTTDRLDQVADGLGAQVGRTRLWRLNFTDITNPDLGGTIDLLVEGGVGNDANMWDNITVTSDGKLLLQEDVGGAAHNGKIWSFDPTTGALTKVIKHDIARFGNLVAGVATAATPPFTNDEEASGIIDVTSMFGGNAAIGDCYFLTSDQAHYSLPAPLVEGGQLVLIHQIAANTGISSSASPYLLPLDSSWKTTSVLTVGDPIPLTGTSTGQTFQMAGLPDGLGAFDNGNGTMTVLVNHEIGTGLGAVRAHGAVGAYVSELIINNSTLQVISGSDLIRSTFGWNAGTQSSNAAPTPIGFNRLCSADLPAVTAFYNAASGLGTQERLFMNGDESGANGYAMAHVATGPNKGKSYVLGKFNLTTNGSGLTGVGGWENILANPYPQNKTVVIGNNDGGTGIMTNSVAVYVGAKTNTGTEADKAGLTNGVIKFVNVTGSTAEIVNTTTRATNITSGAAFILSATASTTFSRPEDGAWDTTNPNRFYFVTTDRLDQVSDGLGSQVGRTRLWRLNFTDITNPDLGGTIDLLVQGGVGNDANMWDNMTVTKEGKLLLQEDVGGAAHNGKIWLYDPATGTLAKVAQHDPSRFGDVTTAATAPFTNDEEGSGIIEVTDLLGGNAAAGEHLFLTSDQAHYPLANPLVEGGQLVLLRQAPKIAFSLAAATASVNEDAGSLTLNVNRFGDLQYAAAVNVNTVNGSAVSGTDYTGLNSVVVSFAPGQATKTLSVPIANRSGYQGNRNFTAALASPSEGAVLGGIPSETVTITEVITPSVIHLDDAIVNANQGDTSATIHLTRTGGSAPVTVRIQATDGTAISGTDYYPPSGLAAVASFPANVNTASVTVTLLQNETAVGNKIFTVTLVNPSANASIGDTQPTVTTVRILSADNKAPALAITAPTPNQILTSAPSNTVTITGTATDNIAVDKVQVKLGAGIYMDATLTPTTQGVNWSIDVAPAGGVNTFSVIARDARGNASAPVSRSFTYRKVSALTITIAGNGTVNGNLPGAVYEVGKSYTLTAIPGDGQVFNGWAGAGLSAPANEVAKFTFVFTDALFANPVIIATFIAKPFTNDEIGSFNGLIAPAAGTLSSNNTNGFMTLNLTATGAFSGTMKIDSFTLAVSGSFTNAGDARFGANRSSKVSVERTNKPSLEISEVHWDSAANTITGVIKQFQRTTLTAKSAFTLDRAAFSAAIPVTPASYTADGGKFTVIIPAKAQTNGLVSIDFPQGDGIGLITVSPAGMVSFTGTLADNTAITASAPLSSALKAPLFAQLYTNRGSFSALVTLDDSQEDTDLKATDTIWFRPFQNRVQHYPWGWDEGVTLDLLGAKYVPVANTAVIPGLPDMAEEGNATLEFNGGLLSGPLSYDVNISNTNAVTNVPATDKSYKLTIAASTGDISGSFTHEDSTKPNFKGKVFTKGVHSGAHGFFLSTQPKDIDGTGESGSVDLLKK